MKRAVMIGAGNIGRGFIGALLEQSGYHVLFADINMEMVNALNARGEYTVHLLAKEIEQLQITNIAAKSSTDPSLAEDIREAEVLTTAVGVATLPHIAPVIAQGIALRADEKNAKSLHIIACENAIRGTSQLKELVKQHLSSEQIAHMEEHVGFLDCEVDCIVPPQDNAELTDVSVEKDYEWVVEKRELKDALAIEGMSLVDVIEPYLERKLYTLNGAFVSSSHLGWLYGLKISNDAAAHPEIVGTTKTFIAEVQALLLADHLTFTEEEIVAYGELSYERMVNPYVIDSVFRHGRDPLRKLAVDERLIAPLIKMRDHKLPYQAHATAVAAALLYDYPGDEQALALQERIASEGVEEVLLAVTTIDPTSEEGVLILAEYERLKAIRARREE